ncbi:hypothetical protein K6119_07065 [Paracrocinitomix mangrovi]|uniref:hypothetical protein n=1 Tax=Paracrocinitomix mangrovi TaxID=2862509 RepID=UPI001C8D8423|nr:hypothetical protein [Paracrocinitomix mangrovi]UKN03273.1 hypothetical protein K6119_07065 [Paracrocinitomix mangrovi]
MKLKLLLLFQVICLVTFCQIDSSFNVFNDSSGFYKIAIPRKWKVIPYSNGGVSAIPNKTICPNNFPANMFIKLYKKKKTISNYANEYFESQIKMNINSEVKILFIEDIEISGLNAKRYRYKKMWLDVPVLGNLILFKYQNKVIQIRQFWEDCDDSNYENIFEIIMNSISFN